MTSIDKMDLLDPVSSIASNSGNSPYNNSSASSQLPSRRTCEAIVALVEQQPITMQQLGRALAVEREHHPHVSSAELLTQALERLIELCLADQIAIERGVDISEADVEEVLLRLASEFGQGDLTGVAEIAGKRGRTLQALRQEIRQQLVWQTLLDMSAECKVPGNLEGRDRQLAQWLANRRRQTRIQYWPERMDFGCA